MISVATEPKIRVLVAKPGLDGHDRGAKVIARALRDAGMEVIYTGLRQTPEMVVNASLQEDVQVIGLSILSGAHNAIVPRVMDLLKQNKMDDVLVLVGGIIPDQDIEGLKKSAWRHLPARHSNGRHRKVHPRACEAARRAGRLNKARRATLAFGAPRPLSHAKDHLIHSKYLLTRKSATSLGMLASRQGLEVQSTEIKTKPLSAPKLHVGSEDHKGGIHHEQIPRCPEQRTTGVHEHLKNYRERARLYPQFAFGRVFGATGW